MSPMLLSFMCPLLLLTPILSALNQKVPRVWGDSWYFQVRNPRSIISQGILGENIGEKMGFLEMTAFVLRVTDNVKFKITQRINHQCYEKRTRRLHMPALFCAVPRSTGSCLLRDCHHGSCLLET